MNKKWIIISCIVLLFVVFLAWLFIESSKPLPGTKMTDLGRKHVPAGTKVEYNSNPPTSGDHYADWIRSGVYEAPKDDGYLIHSLEHGYIILSYKCNPPSGARSEKLDEEATESGEVIEDEECQARKSQLSKVYEKKSKRKLIVAPRQNLDTNFALTAWNYIDKFNDFDEQRITKFIDAHLNQGPEKTME